jgi:hypothetical protein
MVVDVPMMMFSFYNVETALMADGVIVCQVEEK